MFGSDPKTTIGGIILSLGLAIQGGAQAAGTPWWIGLIGTALAVVGGAMVGKSAADAKKSAAAK